MGVYSEEDGFIPLAVMPTGRLNDHMMNLETKNISVLNLDASFPPKLLTPQLLMTILRKVSEKERVHTLSLRFNILPSEIVELLIQWVESNNTLQTLYIMNCGPDMWKARERLKVAWSKNLTSHRSDNNDQTLIRV